MSTLRFEKREISRSAQDLSEIDCNSIFKRLLSCVLAERENDANDYRAQRAFRGGAEIGLVTPSNTVLSRNKGLAPPLS
jgi:hypothetical protein